MGFGRLFPLQGRSCGVFVGTLVVLQQVSFNIFREASTNLSLLHHKRWGVDKFWHSWRKRGGQEERAPLNCISFLVYSSMHCSPPLQILAYRSLSVRCDWLIHSGPSKHMTRSISFWLRCTAGVFFWQGISILWVLNPYGKLSINSGYGRCCNEWFDPQPCVLPLLMPSSRRLGDYVGIRPVFVLGNGA